MTADTSKSLDLHAHPEVGASPAASKDAPTDERSSIDRTCNEALQVATGFLEEAARYFENRPTNGEDRAHWANVQNAENCRKVATHVAALTSKLKSLQARLEDVSAQLEAERAEKAQWVEALKDPAAVRLNILRGGIAKPEWRSMLDLYDEKLEHWDRLREAVNYIAQHDNSGLTDGSGATRQCIDRLVEIARNAVDSKFEADLTTRLSSETARADKDVAEAKALRAENDTMRGILANSTLDCVYCGLPSVRMNECASGFPGCARADDIAVSATLAQSRSGSECDLPADTTLSESVSELRSRGGK